MAIAQLMLSFWGRIDLRAYWLGGMAALVIFYFGYMATLAPDLTTGVAAAVIASLGIPMMLLALFCGGALSVKRLHDRGRSGWLVLLMVGPLYSAGSYVTGYGALPASLGGLSLAIHGVNAIIALFFVIDLGCQTGRPEPNKYDEEPNFAFIAQFVNSALTQASAVLGDAKTIAKEVKAAAHPAQSTAPATPQPSAFANVEAALDRAIAAQKDAPAPAKSAAATPKRIESPTPPSGPKSFGRRA